MPSYFKEIPTGNINVYEGANKKVGFSPKKFALKELSIANAGTLESIVDCYFFVTNEINNSTETIYLIKQLKIPVGTSVNIVDKDKNATDEFSVVISNSTSGSFLEAYIDYEISSDSKFINTFRNNTSY